MANALSDAEVLKEGCTLFIGKPLLLINKLHDLQAFTVADGVTVFVLQAFDPAFRQIERNILASETPVFLTVSMAFAAHPSVW